MAESLLLKCHFPGADPEQEFFGWFDFFEFFFSIIFEVIELRSTLNEKAARAAATKTSSKSSFELTHQLVKSLEVRSSQKCRIPLQSKMSEARPVKNVGPRRVATRPSVQPIHPAGGGVEWTAWYTLGLQGDASPDNRQSKMSAEIFYYNWKAWALILFQSMEALINGIH